MTSVRDFLNRSAGRVSRQRRRPVAGLLLLLLGLVLTGSLYATLAPSSSADSAANDEELIAEGRQHDGVARPRAPSPCGDPSHGNPRSGHVVG